MYDMDPLSVVLIGSRAFGVAVADQLSKRYCVDLTTICAPEGDRLAEPRDGITIHTDDLNPSMIPPETDLIIAAHNHRFIPLAMLAKTHLGGISYHPSLLPRHRGRDAIAWAIRDRDPITGGTVYWLDERVDGGPIAAQDWCWIQPDDDASSLWQRELFPMGLKLIEQTLSDILTGKPQYQEQDEALATWEPSRRQSPLATQAH